jgi:hypothetical protein
MTKNADDGARATLRLLLKPGSPVYTVLRHRSASGMMRCFKLLIVAKDYKGKPDIRDISYLAAKAAGFPYNTTYEGIQTNGCGMDMGFHCVYSLSRRLWPKGFKVLKGQLGRNGDTSGFDTDGGYALEHRRI